MDIGAAFDSLSPSPEGDALALATDQELLELLDRADLAVSMAEAERAQLIAEAERRESAMKARLCSTATFLAGAQRHSPRRARQIVADALAVQGFPLVAAATVRGQASYEQGMGIAAGLAELPDTLSANELSRGPGDPARLL